MKFVVAHINFFENVLTQEIINADSKEKARCMHSETLKHESSDWNMFEETKDMNDEDFGEYCFDMEIQISYIEIPETLIAESD
jgi:hypothetical protein